MSAWDFLSSGLLQIVFTKNISTKILILILISISSKSWGAALCGYGGRMSDTAVLGHPVECLMSTLPVSLNSSCHLLMPVWPDCFAPYMLNSNHGVSFCVPCNVLYFMPYGRHCNDHTERLIKTAVCELQLGCLCNSVSETVWVHGYTASTNIISVFVPEFQVFEIPTFLLVYTICINDGFICNSSVQVWR
jgi:hypothetical protein